MLPAQFNSVKLENALRVIVQSVGIKNYALLRDEKKEAHNFCGEPPEVKRKSRLNIRTDKGKDS